MPLRLPAGEEPWSSQAPLENTVANVNQSLMDVPEEEGKGRFNGDFPVKQVTGIVLSFATKNLGLDAPWSVCLPKLSPR